MYQNLSTNWVINRTVAYEAENLSEKLTRFSWQSYCIFRQGSPDKFCKSRGSWCRHHIRTTVPDWIHLSGRLCSWSAPVFAVFSCNTVLETGSSRARRQYRIVMGQYNSVDIGILKPNRIVCINVKNIVIIQQMIKYRSIALKNLKFAFENLSKTIIEIYRTKRSI